MDVTPGMNTHWADMKNENRKKRKKHKKKIREFRKLSLGFQVFLFILSSTYYTRESKFWNYIR